MNHSPSVSQHVEKNAQLLSTEQSRQRIVRATLDFVSGTALYPSRYEQFLLVQFVRGNLTIDQVVQRVDQWQGNKGRNQ
jgi:hypothetical protein